MPGYKNNGPSRYSKAYGKKGNRFRNYLKSIKAGPKYSPVVYKGRAFSGLPDAKIVNMNYSEYCRIDAVAGAQDTYVFRLASIYDPDLSGTGHQPRNRDEWYDLYQTYTVLGADIKVQFCSTTNALPVSVAGIRISHDETPATNRYDMLELSDYKSCIVGNGATFPTLRMKYDPCKTFGIKDIEDEDLLSASMGSNPSKNAFLHVSTAAADQTTAEPDPIVAIVQIVYKVLLRQPYDQTVS